MKLRLLFLGWTAIFSVLTLGAETVLTGPCGSSGAPERVHWTLSEDRGTLTFSGDGHVKNVGPNNELSPPSSYHGYNGLDEVYRKYFEGLNIPYTDHAIPFSDDVPVSVVYEDGVESTGNFFFFSVREEGEFWEWGPNFDPVSDGKYDCITSVKFGSTIREISRYSFYGCTGLTEVDFGAPVHQVTIGDRAFGRTSIKKMILPANVTPGQESLMRCPLEQVIIISRRPYHSKGYIGQFFKRDGIYQRDESAPVTEVYVPDVDAYSGWEPTPKPMLKEGKYSLEDAALGNITIACNIPGYEASTDYKLDLREGTHMVWIPVKFTGEREFEATVLYTYTAEGDPTAASSKSGYCGDFWASTDPMAKYKAKWMYSGDGVLTIWGEGMTQDCNPQSGVGPGFWSFPADFYKSASASVVFEDDISGIGPYFFGSFASTEISNSSPNSSSYDPTPGNGFDCITSVKLNRNLSWIGDFAFYGCSGLTEIDFGEPKIVSIGERAFGGTSIKKMFIPDNVKLKQASLVRCPLEQVIITNPVPTVDKAYIGQFSYRSGKFYQDTSVPATDVYVPDADAYSAWEPTPKPMLKEGKYSLDDAALGNITIASNIPGYEASTDYRFDQLDEGVYTVWLPVKFTGERDFETTVKYTYTVGNPPASVGNVANDSFSVKASGGALVVSGATGPVAVFNMTGQKVYEGKENQIALPGGIYVVTFGGRAVKIRL